MERHVHGDIKPENFGYDPVGRSWYILDVESADMLPPVDDTLKCNSMPMHTPHYAAPEILAPGEPTLSITSDLYSIGVIHRDVAKVCSAGHVLCVVLCECACHLPFVVAAVS